MNWKNIFSGNSREKVDTLKDNSREPDNVTCYPRAAAGEGCCFTATVELKDENQIGRAALLLASTSTQHAERDLKGQIVELGWKAVATEVGGLAGELPQKLTRALVGASLNSSIIKKEQKEMHALMHAAVEAMDGFLQKAMLEASVGAKIGIVRNENWIAVAVMGDTAYHAVAHHERCGLGVMHI